MSNRSLLEIRLHLANGRTSTYVQNDPEIVGKMLRQIHRKVFQLPSIVIAGKDEVCAFRGSALSGISVLIDPLPMELAMLDSGLADVWSIPEEEFRERQALLRLMDVRDPDEILGEIELASGQRLWTIQRVTRNSVGGDPRLHLRHAFDLPSLVCRRRDGGISIWNRQQIVSMAFTPGIDAAAAWPAETPAERYSRDERGVPASDSRERLTFVSTSRRGSTEASRVAAR